MGETFALFPTKFNGSLRIEPRLERLTSDAGAVVLREILERLGVVEWMDERLEDPRNPALVTHPLSELLRTALLLVAQGWRDQDDADDLRDDPTLRLAVSNRKGISPLLGRTGESADKRSKIPDGLASQPTLSRLHSTLAKEENRLVLREALLEIAARRLRALRGGHRHRYVTIDVDGLPIQVHGHQPGSAHNGHYRTRIYHPIVAAAAETGDLLDIQLRKGNVHGASGALDFITSLVDRVERELCQVASVRMDAGFPAEELLAALESRGTPYVARVRNNARLNKLAGPYLKRPAGRPPAEPRTWLHELEYRAGSWSKDRRVVLVVMERPGELFLHHFWLITSWTPEQQSAADLLALYRQRGAAEGNFGEFKSAIGPALSSSPRQKSHYRQQKPKKRTEPVDSFAQNETTLLLHALAYNLVHVARVLLERSTGEGWSLLRVRERALRTAGRFVLHARRAVLVIGTAPARLWSGLWRELRAMTVTAIG